MNFLHRYLAPFLTGVCMAGVTVAQGVPWIAALILAGGVLGYFSLPAGGRTIRRFAGISS